MRKDLASNQLSKIGEICDLNGNIIEIIEYLSTHCVTVKFEDGYTNTGSYKSFKKGEIRNPNPYLKRFYGVGYLGEGNYKTSINGEKTPQYLKWFAIFVRCYSENLALKEPTYANCEICEDWHNFQNFAKWYDENYYSIDGRVMELDKDILVKGNKLYSPDNCVFVSNDINSLFTKRKNKRGDYPLGVSRNEGCDSYKSQCNNEGKRVYLGSYSTPQQAFLVYKTFKEQVIKKTADKYINQIPKRLYDALYAYQVEMND